MGVFNRRNPQVEQRLRVVQGSALPKPQQEVTLGPRSLPFSAHRSLTAAASLVDIQTAEGRTQFARRRASSQGWQDEAWTYLDAIGEISYAFTVVANALSRIRLYTAQVIDPAAPPIAADPDNQTGQASIEILDRLNSAFGGIPGLLRDAAMNLQVTGEALDVDTPVSTPDGFVRIGDLEDGDVIYGGDGSTCSVIAAHPVQEGRPCYEVVFSDGTVVVADEDHLWTVHRKTRRSWAAKNGTSSIPEILRTKDMVEEHRKYGTCNYAVEVASLGDGSYDETPIDPYILGYWLGDGWSNGGTITAHPNDHASLRSQVERAGYQWSERPSGRGFQIGILGLQADLRKHGYLHNKHVGDEYLNGSVATRLAVLQGLIDSDGHVSNKGCVEFCNKNLVLIDAVVKLAASLGHKVGQVKSRDDGTFRVVFLSKEVPVCRLPRKASNLRGYENEESKWRYVREINKVDSRPVRCITVTSPDATFLVTDRLIKTHNCLLVQRPANPFANPPTPESWDIRSVDEMQLSPDGRWVIVPREDGDKASGTLLPKNAFVARVWRPHPRYSDSSTSSMRPLLDLAAELMLLNKTFRSTARSRLNSGMLYLPDGLSVAASPDPDAFASTENELEDPDGNEAGAFPSTSAFDAAEQSDTDEFEEALLEAMTTPIADEESAAAVVPLLVRGPADLGEKIKLIQFERTFDPTLATRAEHVLDRIMQGLDVPKEITQGLSKLKFSTAQIVDQQLYQAHVEPLALLICDALTTVYLRPALRSLGLPEDEIRKHVIWYDASEVTTRPNRAEDADKGYENHTIAAASWRRAHNFTDDDAPTSTELAMRLLIEKAQFTPELAESLLTVIAPEIMQAVRDASQAANPAPLPSDVASALEPAASGEPPEDTGGVTPSSSPTPTSPPAAPPAAPEPFPGEENLV